MFPPPHPQDFKSARCPPSLQDPGFSTATGSVWQTPFPLTSGTNSAWHVWRGCSVFEPRPRRDYSMQPGSPRSTDPCPLGLILWGVWVRTESWSIAPTGGGGRSMAPCAPGTLEDGHRASARSSRR